MFCPQCGGDVTGARFCGRCGRAIASPGVSDFGVADPFASVMQFAPPQQGSQTRFVTFGQAIQAGFKGYVVWNARSTRAEYWWWTLFVFLVGVAVLIVDAVVTMGLLYLIYVFGSFLPNLSVTIRRLHDTDRHGGWFWIILVPIAGPIILLIFTLLASTPGPTRWNRSLVSELP